MAIHPFTLDYSDAQTIQKLQVQAVQTVRKSSISEKTNNRIKERKKFHDKEKQNKHGKELKIVFSKLDLIFEYSIDNHKINIKIYDKYNELILEDNIEDLEDLLASIKNEKGKIIDLKI